jgi:hypothetical protein
MHVGKVRHIDKTRQVNGRQGKARYIGKNKTHRQGNSYGKDTYARHTGKERHIGTARHIEMVR